MSENKIEIHCESCDCRNQMAERLIARLQERLNATEERYEIFKEVARRSRERKTFLQWLFS